MGCRVRNTRRKLHARQLNIRVTGGADPQTAASDAAAAVVAAAADVVAAAAVAAAAADVDGSCGS